MTIRLEALDASQPIVVQNARFVDDEHNDFLLGTSEHPGLFE